MDKRLRKISVLKQSTTTKNARIETWSQVFRLVLRFFQPGRSASQWNEVHHMLVTAKLRNAGFLSRNHCGHLENCPYIFGFFNFFPWFLFSLSPLFCLHMEPEKVTVYAHIAPVKEQKSNNCRVDMVHACRFTLAFSESLAHVSPLPPADDCCCSRYLEFLPGALSHWSHPPKQLFLFHCRREDCH